MPTFKLSWKQDCTQPLPTGQVAHVDQKFEDNLHLFGTKLSQVNGIVDLRKWAPPVDNQGDASDCVADSTTSALELLEIESGLKFVKKSRLFLYYNARLQTQETDKDKGTYIRLAFATLTSLGTCTEATWPYDLSKIAVRPSWKSYREAFSRKINSYYRIDATDGSALVDAIKQVIRAGHPVVFGMTVDQNYMDTGYDGRVAMPTANRQNAGGHAQVIVGYDDNLQRYIVKNSWGTSWGDGGYGYVPYGYLDASGANDLWVPYLNVHQPDVSVLTVTMGSGE